MSFTEWSFLLEKRAVRRLVMLEVNRKELKYLLGLDEVYTIKTRLEKITEEDPHNGTEGYTVRSLYFDTPSDKDYQEKIDGTDNRVKIRMRIYDGDTSNVKLELKAKDGDFQRKRSIALSGAEANRMIESDYTFLMERKESFARGMYTMLVTRGYAPKCIVEYDRIAFVEKFNDIRITFDMRLRALEDPTEFMKEMIDAYPVEDPSEVTMEVKYSGFLFTYIKRALGSVDKMRISNSKYVRARAFVKQ